MASLIGGSDAFTSFGGTAPAAPVGNVASWNSDTGAINTTPAVVVADTIQNSEGVKYLTEDDISDIKEVTDNFQVDTSRIFVDVEQKRDTLLKSSRTFVDKLLYMKEGDVVYHDLAERMAIIDNLVSVNEYDFGRFTATFKHVEYIFKVDNDGEFVIEGGKLKIPVAGALTDVGAMLSSQASSIASHAAHFIALAGLISQTRVDLLNRYTKAETDAVVGGLVTSQITPLQNKTTNLNSDGSTFSGGVNSTSDIQTTSDVKGRYFVGHLHHDEEEIHNDDHDTSNIWSDGLNVRFNRCTSTAIGEVKHGGFSDSVQLPKTWYDSTGGGLNQMLISKTGKLKMILKRAKFNNTSEPYSTVNAGYNDQSFVELLSKSQNKLQDSALEIDCKTVKCDTITATTLIGDARQLTGINTIVADLVTSYTVSSDSISLKTLIDNSVGKRWEVIVKGFEGPYFQIIPPIPNTPGILDPGGAFHRRISPVQFPNVSVRGVVRTPLERTMSGYVEPQYLPQAPQPSLGASFIRWKNHLAVASAGVSDPTTFGDITFSWVTNEQLNGVYYPVLRMLKYLYKNITDEIVYNTGVCVRKMLSSADLATIAYDQATNTIRDTSKIPQLWDTTINATSSTVTNAINNDTITRGTFQNVFIENQAGQKMRLDGTYEYEYGSSTRTREWPMDLNYDHFGISFGAKVSTDTGEEIKFINEEINMIKATKHHLTAPLLRPSLQLNTLVTTNDIINLSGQFTLHDVPFNLYGGFRQTVIEHNGELYPALRLYQTIGETVADTLGDGFPQFQHLTNAAENKTAYISLLQNGTMLVNDVFIKRETIGGDNKYHRAITWEELPVLIGLASLPDPNNDNKVPPGAVITAGDDLNIAKSPFPLAYVDSNGKLNASTLYSSKFSDQVFGADDPDLGANRKPSPYAVGLVPGSDTLSAAERLTKYLRADGTWHTVDTIPAQPTFEKIVVENTGSQETIGLFKSSDNDCSVRIQGAGEAYLELANTDSGGSTTHSWGIGCNDNNRLEFNWKPLGTTLNATKNALTLLNTGKVGINKGHNKVPTEALDVNGVCKATSYKGNGSTLTFDAGVTCSGLSWTHSTTNVTHTLDDVMDDIETLLPLIGEIDSLPKIDPINSSNFICITSLVNGGTVANASPSTDLLSIEGANKWYTDARVDARVNHRLTQTLPALVAQSVQAQTFTAQSDLRLKHDIEYMSGCEDLKRLKPCSYRFINGDQTKRYGFIAQDLENTCPELVEDGDRKSVKYLDTIAILTTALQNAISRIEHLENLISRPQA